MHVLPALQLLIGTVPLGSAWCSVVASPLCCACPCLAGAPSLPLHATSCWCLGGCSLPRRSRPRASVRRVWGVHVCLAGCGVCMGGGGLRQRLGRCSWVVVDRFILHSRSCLAWWPFARLSLLPANPLQVAL